MKSLRDLANIADAWDQSSWEDRHKEEKASEDLHEGKGCDLNIKDESASEDLGEVSAQLSSRTSDEVVDLPPVSQGWSREELLEATESDSSLGKWREAAREHGSDFKWEKGLLRARYVDHMGG